MAGRVRPLKLSPREIELIRESHARLLPEAQRVSEEFYKDLFSREPEIKGLFREDLSEQGMRFMSAIHVIVDNLHDMEAMDAQIERLAAGHAALHIKPLWYRHMQEALIDTFAAALGERFTNEIELAWRSAFSQICDRMAEKAGQKPA
jgi:hemoglobin-like flavoprotein